MKIHIIDGYNAIHSSEALSKILSKEEGIKLAREEIVRRCAEKFKNSFIIVFDGKRGGKTSDYPNTIFTSEGVTADEVILDLVSRYYSKKYVVYVYSRDKSLREKARLRGAIPCDPEEIFNETRKLKADRESSDIKSKNLKKYNWEKEFGISEEKSK